MSIAYRCNKCKKYINQDKHDFVFVDRMRWGDKGEWIGDLHFCSPECLIKFMDKTGGER